MDVCCVFSVIGTASIIGSVVVRKQITSQKVRHDILFGALVATRNSLL